jgi:hypothetical protein
VAGIASEVSRAFGEEPSTGDLIQLMLRIRDRFWDFNSFCWSAPQALGWMCETVLKSLLEELGVGIEKDALLGGENSYTFRTARRLQQLGKSITEPRVLRAFRELRLDQILPTLMNDEPHCEFLRQYESFCWDSGKPPPNWLTRPPFWSTGANDVQWMHSIKCAVLSRARDVDQMRQAAVKLRGQSEKSLLESVDKRHPDQRERVLKVLYWTRCWTQALNERHAIASPLLWEKELMWQVELRLHRADVFGTPDEILLFFREDLIRYARTLDDAKLKQLRNRRKLEYESNLRLQDPSETGPRSESSSLPAQIQAESSSAVDSSPAPTSFSGEGMVAGQVTGRARLVYDLYDPALLDSLSTNDILVLPYEYAFFYSNWHSLLTLVRGVVSPGKPSHHLIQVARECRVPVVGQVVGDLGTIHEGVEIRIDGRTGEIVFV